jgi:hypothetical protein
MLNLLKYNPIRNQPFYKFYYKGSHSHPVQRTVLVTTISDTHITGYELREGNTARNIDTSPIRSYRREKIANRTQLRNDNCLRTKKLEKSTLQKCGVKRIIVDGI